MPEWCQNPESLKIGSKLGKGANDRKNHQFYRLTDALTSNKIKKETPQSIGITAFLVRPSGFEPLAFRLGGGRSILLSYGRVGRKLLNLVPPGSDVQLLRRRMLYPAELLGHIRFLHIVPALPCPVNEKGVTEATPLILLINQSHGHESHSPDS